MFNPRLLCNYAFSTLTKEEQILTTGEYSSSTTIPVNAITTSGKKFTDMLYAPNFDLIHLQPLIPKVATILFKHKGTVSL